MPTVKVNKVKYGIKNVYMAKITSATAEGYTYGTPFRVPGAQVINLANQFASQSIPADDDPDYVTLQEDQGYDGTLQVVTLPVEFEEQILNETNGIENVDNKMSDFALMYEFDGDVKKARNCLWHCVLTKRPDIVHNTKDNNLSVDNDTINIKVVKRKDTGDIKGKAYADWAVYENMFTAVPEPSAFVKPSEESANTETDANGSDPDNG